MLRIIVRYWENTQQQDAIDKDDIKNALEEIRTELSPKLHEIWLRLSLSEQRIMQQIARSQKERFHVDEVFTEQKNYTNRDLKRLVDRQILACRSQDTQYTVRLGLLVDLISYGILSYP